MLKLFYIEYTDQFGKSAELEIAAELVSEDITEFDRYGREYKVAERHKLASDILINNHQGLSLTKDDLEEITAIVEQKIERLD